MKNNWYKQVFLSLEIHNIFHVEFYNVFHILSSWYSTQHNVRIVNMVQLRFL